MKLNNWVGLLFAAALTLGACSNDEKDFESSGINIAAPFTSEVILSSVTVKCTFQQSEEVRYTNITRLHRHDGKQ